MNRAILCGLISVITAVLVIGSTAVLKGEKGSFFDDSEECLQSYYSDSFDFGERLAVVLKDVESYCTKARFFTDYTSLEEISVAAAQLEDLADNGGGDFPAQINALREMIAVNYKKQTKVV